MLRTPLGFLVFAFLSTLLLAVNPLGSAPLPNRLRTLEVALPGGVKMEFVWVPSGTFWMSKDGKNAQKQVTVGQDFYIGKYEVTQEQWQAVMGSNPSTFSRTGEYKDRVKDISAAELEQFPMDNVSWEDCQEFLKKVNVYTEKSGFQFSLPSEAQWEYACRAAARTQADCSFDFYLAKPTNDLSSKQANFDGNFPGGDAPKALIRNRPTKVGSYPPNELRIYDMHGNVEEWCQDRYDTVSLCRMTRGGSWFDEGQDVRAAHCNGYQPDSRFHIFGFRCVAIPSPSK